MSDRELLEMAAKAIGLSVIWNDRKNSMDVAFPMRGQNLLWNPLTDDGDALRLAVKLTFDIYIYGDSVAVMDIDLNHEEQPAGGDLPVATRRAIVRAAAEIGRSMP